MQIEFSSRDKEATLQTLKLVQADRDHLASQTAHWDDLRRAAEQLETLTKVIGQADDEEIAELRRIKDRSKVLEGEHAALQKRFRDQESKVASIERASLQARQGLAQAQHRAAEWEKKARAFEAEVERLSTSLEQSEQARIQLDTDYSLAKLQIEEHEAEDRLSKVYLPYDSCQEKAKIP